MDGREVIFEIAGGTNPQGGSLTISMNVTPSEEIDGTVHSAFSIGNDNEPLDVKVTYAGAAGQSVVLIADEVFEELGTIGTDNSFNIAQGGQYVLATLAPKSNDASLESIAIDGTPLSGFKAGKTSYQYYVPAGTKSVVVTAEMCIRDRRKHCCHSDLVMAAADQHGICSSSSAGFLPDCRECLKLRWSRYTSF